MKNLTDMINEASDISYRVLMTDVTDKNGDHLTVTILVDKNSRGNFEKWLEEQEGNLFMHAEGGAVEY